MHNSRLGFSRMRGAIVLGSVLLVVGCAVAPTRWVHPDRPKDTVDADRGYCETLARSQTVRPQAPPPSVNFTGLASIFRMVSESSLDREYEAELDRQVSECLQKKGWRRAESR